MGCKNLKRKEVRKGQNGSLQRVLIPRRSPIQLQTPPDRALLRCSDENQCVPCGIVRQGKEAKLLFVFSKKYIYIYFCS